MQLTESRQSAVGSPQEDLTESRQSAVGRPQEQSGRDEQKPAYCPLPTADYRVALVHDWLNGMRGGEKVLDALCEHYPDADVFTLFYVRGTVSDTIARHRIVTSSLQRLPFARTHYRRYARGKGPGPRANEASQGAAFPCR